MQSCKSNAIVEQWNLLHTSLHECSPDDDRNHRGHHRAATATAICIENALPRPLCLAEGGVANMHRNRGLYLANGGPISRSGSQQHHLIEGHILFAKNNPLLGCMVARGRAIKALLPTCARVGHSAYFTAKIRGRAERGTCLFVCLRNPNCQGVPQCYRKNPDIICFHI